MKKLSMGQYLAAQLEALGKVTKVGYGSYFNTAQLGEAAKCLDRIMIDRVGFGEMPSKLETIGLEMLMSLAGYETNAAFCEAYNTYASRFDATEQVTQPDSDRF